MEKKAGVFHFKDVDPARRKVTGYISAFGNVDLDKDVIVKGAYARTIQERGPAGSKQIKYLLDHRTDKAVGVFDTLQEDDFGLYYEATLGTHQLGVDYGKMVESGIITEHSVMFRTMDSEFREDGVRVIKELELYEGSGLQFLGANPNTPITGLKSFDELKRLLDTLETAIKSGNYTDETFETIIIPRYEAIKALRPANPDQDLINTLNLIQIR